MPILCRCPPLNSWGYRSAACFQRPHRSSRSSTRAWARRLGEPVDDEFPDQSPHPHPRIEGAAGILKMICMSRRSARMSVADCWNTDFVEDDFPLVAGTSRSSVRPTVVLPHPLSPTRPSVSPAPSSKLTPSTALT